jgi:hypothetical protein
MSKKNENFIYLYVASMVILKMKHHLFLLLICLVTNISTLSQPPIDLDAIKKLAEDTAATSNYRLLIDEFNQTPLALDTIKGTLLYYGKIFTKGYAPYKINFDEINFTELVLKRKYKEAIAKGEGLLKSDPINLEILSKILLCYSKASIKNKAETTKAKVDLLVSSILTHGDGQSEYNTLKVISVGDEYAMMGILGITGLSRNSKLSGKSTFDIWKAKNSKGKRIDFFVEILLTLGKD